MRIVISDLTIATCELTGKENVECLRVQLDDGTPELFCRPAELIKLLRFKRSQQAKLDAPSSAMPKAPPK